MTSSLRMPMRVLTLGLGAALVLLVYAVGAHGAQQVSHSLTVDRVSKRFVPHHAAVRNGDRVTFCNHGVIVEHEFSIGPYNRFGEPKALEQKQGQCSGIVVHNPTNAPIVISVFDDLHSTARMFLIVLPDTGELPDLTGSWQPAGSPPSPAWQLRTVSPDLFMLDASWSGGAGHSGLRGTFTGHIDQKQTAGAPLIYTGIAHVTEAGGSVHTTMDFTIINANEISLSYQQSNGATVPSVIMRRVGS
jgi:hypothetical protein